MLTLLVITAVLIANIAIAFNDPNRFAGENGTLNDISSFNISESKSVLGSESGLLNGKSVANITLISNKKLWITLSTETIQLTFWASLMRNATTAERGVERAPCMAK
ncbi:MAG: hypothetical protein R3Y10_11955 [Ferrimonas sp.]